MSRVFCAYPNATVLDAQNGRSLDTEPTVKAKCGKGKGRRR
jgi:hypothetical protein